MTTVTSRATQHRHRCPRHGGRRGLRGQAGSSAVFVVVVAVALLTAGGLVLDGGYALAARRTALNDAEQAARIGADALDQAQLRSGTVAVDATAAQAAATDYLAQVGATGTVTVAGDTVTVTVTAQQDTVILSAVGVESIRVAATSRARSISPATASDAGAAP